MRGLGPSHPPNQNKQPTIHIMKNLKKLILLGSPALLLASCSQDEIVKSELKPGDVVKTNLIVSIPKTISTRSLGDGSAATNLYISVFDVDGGTKNFVFPSLASFNRENNTATVNLDLVVGKSYFFTFFAGSPNAVSTQEADAATAVYYLNPETGLLTVNYTKMTSEDNLADAYDCFYGTYSTGVISSALEPENVELVRPVAQINWGTTGLTSSTSETTTSNYENVFGSDGAWIQTNLSVTNPYTTFNLQTGEYGTTATTVDNIVTISGMEVPEDETFPGSSDYNYVAAYYLLAPAQNTYDLTLNITNAGAPSNSNVSAHNISIPVSGAPVQANYQTNIYGSLLTSNASFSVSLSTDWSVNNLPQNSYTISPEDLNGLMINQSGTYYLTGESLEGTYPINMVPNLDVIIDGSQISVAEGENKLHLIFQDDSSFQTSPQQILENKPRNGSYTFKNFTGGNISIKTGNTTINVVGNTVDEIDMAAGNVNVNISNNNINGGGILHPRWDGQSSKNCVYLHLTDYNLSFNNNYLDNANGGSFQINGWMLNDPVGSWIQNDLMNRNKISSFSGNTMIITEYEAQESKWTCAITFLGDGTFYMTNNDTASPEFTGAFLDFMKLVNSSDNKFYISGDATGAYYYKISNLNTTENSSVRYLTYTTQAPATSEPVEP